ncbi:MAG: hypothetical protein LR015_03235 [Verrucomicrobia bacterium]|nr:hypothetical protein [Verrucomicrobiota bacterium]
MPRKQMAMTPGSLSSAISRKNLRGATQSAAGDGIANLLRFAFGMDPQVPSRVGMPELQFSGAILTLRYRVSAAARDANLSVIPLQSNTLEHNDWQPVALNKITSDGFDADGNEHFIITIDTSAGQVFLRLKIGE